MILLFIFCYNFLFIFFVFDILIYKDDTMNENNIEDIIKRLDGIFNNVGYRKILGQANNNWLGLSVDEVTDFVIIYFKSLSKLSV